MNSLRLAIAFLPLFSSTTFFLHASSTLPLRIEDLVQISGAIFRGTVIRGDSFKGPDGLIYTSTSLHVDERFKGTLPPTICVVHRGGQVGTESEYSGLSPQFINGNEYLLFTRRGSNGRLQCTQGSASAISLSRISNAFQSPGAELLATVRQLTSGGKMLGDDASDQVGDTTPQAAVGMQNGIASRFVQPDRGEPVPILIDVNPASLPAGITMTQATNAVQQALNAWSAVTSLKFKLEGIQSFGQGADTLTDIVGEKLWIQLHDNYNSIIEPNVLGYGGRAWDPSIADGTGWRLGGTIGTNDFFKTVRGFVVLETTNSAMQNLATFTEVLTHEIGHALSLAHSSELVNEPNTALKQAIMYFQAHADGRGAMLGAYDIPVIQQAYPQFNTAPYTYERVMDIVTQPIGAPNVPGINEVEMRGYDLQSTNLTISTSIIKSVGGTFTQVGNLIKYTPNDFYEDVRLNPASGAYYDALVVRFSDGSNFSPYVYLRTISDNPDNFPRPGGVTVSDGLPDAWMVTYWGNANPAAGPNRGAGADFDGDRLSNLTEYRAGMDPTSTNSSQRLSITSTNIQWQAKPYELYEVLSSTNLTTWTRFGNPVLPTNTPASISLTRTNSRQFFRVVKVP